MLLLYSNSSVLIVELLNPQMVVNVFDRLLADDRRDDWFALLQVGTSAILTVNSVELIFPTSSRFCVVYRIRAVLVLSCGVWNRLLLPYPWLSMTQEHLTCLYIQEIIYQVAALRGTCSSMFTYMQNNIHVHVRGIWTSEVWCYVQL